jgi:fructose-bisphosphate aldolase class II
MPLAGIKQILTEARRRRYGVLSLLAGNLEMVIGQIGAAEAQRAPLILAFNQEVTPKVPIELAMPFLVDAAKRASVPVATILDHGQSLEATAVAMQLGSSSVMYDGSTLPYEENVARTREVARLAHALGVDVEAELGSIGGSAVESGAAAGAGGGTPESTFTDPEMAADFCQRTGVDALAISFGNVHGTYQGEPVLDLARVRAIHAAVDVPLVMHGASGLDDSEYQEIVESGISKVCYYTAMGKAAVGDLARMLADAGQDEVVYHQLISRTIEFFDADTRRLMDIVGCSGAVAEPTNPRPLWALQ